MGQVNLVRNRNQVPSTKTIVYSNYRGIADDPVFRTSSAAMVNGAIHSFVKAVALELPAGQRINVVSPGLVEGSVDKYASYFPGFKPHSLV